MLAKQVSPPLPGSEVRVRCSIEPSDGFEGMVETFV
jgi:hypothetical protein